MPLLHHSVLSLTRSTVVYRSFSTVPFTMSRDPITPFIRPSPPPLPPKEQAEFERLVKQQQAPFSSSDSNQETEVHPDLRVKPPPEFEGDINPKTGEVGGPKRDPLKWEREWAYGGRVSDNLCPVFDKN